LLRTLFSGYLARTTSSGNLAFNSVLVLPELEVFTWTGGPVKTLHFQHRAEQVGDLGCFHELESLSVAQSGGVQHVDFKDFAQCKVLTRLCLRLDGFSSTLLGVGLLPGSLTDLDVTFEGAPLVVTIPSEIGRLVNLSRLLIAGLRVGGSIPTEIGQLANMKHMCLNGTSLSGRVPTEIGNLFGLEELTLTFNKRLHGALPSLNKLVNLKRLSFLGTEHLSAPDFDRRGRWIDLFGKGLAWTCDGHY
jgi:hypothetical protein